MPKIRYLYNSYQKSESIKIAKKLLVTACYFAQRSAPQRLCEKAQFLAADTAASCSTAIVAVGPVGILPPTSAVSVSFSAPPSLPPASPIYIPQTGGFEIT